MPRQYHSLPTVLLKLQIKVYPDNICKKSQITARDTQELRKIVHKNIFLQCMLHKQLSEIFSTSCVNFIPFNNMQVSFQLKPWYACTIMTSSLTLKWKTIFMYPLNAMPICDKNIRMYQITRMIHSVNTLDENILWNIFLVYLYNYLYPKYVPKCFKIFEGSLIFRLTRF